MKKVFQKKVAYLVIAVGFSCSLMSFSEKRDSELYGISTTKGLNLTQINAPEKVAITGALVRAARVVYQAVTRASHVVDEVTQATATWLIDPTMQAQNEQITTKLKMKGLD